MSDIYNEKAFCFLVRNTPSQSPFLFLHEHVFLSMLYDTGANASLCNDVSVFVDGSVRECDVKVYGIGSTGEYANPLHARLCGDVNYDFGNGESVLIRDVHYVEGGALGELPSAGDEPTVLLSISELLRNSEVGVNFVQGGGSVQIVRGDKVLHTHSHLAAIVGYS